MRVLDMVDAPARILAFEWVQPLVGRACWTHWVVSLGGGQFGFSKLLYRVWILV